MNGAPDRFGVTYTSYWGDANAAIAQAGGKDAQLLAWFLTTNPDATMIGLYVLDLREVKATIGTLNAPQIAKAFRALELVEFADYDVATRVVWVREMAKDRLALHTKPLAASDNRVKAAHRLYANARPNPFLSQFFDRYRVDLHLTQRRTFTGERQRILEGIGSDGDRPSRPGQGRGKGLGRGFEAPSSATGSPSEGASEGAYQGAPKGLGRGSEGASGIRDQQDPDQNLDQGSEDRDQVEQRAAARDSRSPVENPESRVDLSEHNRAAGQAYGVHLVAAHEVLECVACVRDHILAHDLPNLTTDEDEQIELIKRIVSNRQIPSNTSVCRKALDSAKVQRQRIADRRRATA